MRQNQLQPIYLCNLPCALNDHLFLTNISELIYDDALDRLLRLCGREVYHDPLRASDYDRFYCYCCATSLLQKNSITDRIQTLLKTCFDIDENCSEESCDQIWNAVNAHLTAHPMNVFDCIRKSTPDTLIQLKISYKDMMSLERFPKSFIPILDANTMLSCDFQSFQQLEIMIDRAFDQLLHFGGSAIFISISHQFLEDIPSLYHFEQAVCSDKKKEGIILTQLLRQLSLKCQMRSFNLYLHILPSAAPFAAALIERIYKAVGLPKTIWFTKTVECNESMIALQANLPIETLRCAFEPSLYPSYEELCLAFFSLLSRYPYGKIQLIYGGDARFLQYEQDRFEKMLLTSL